MQKKETFSFFCSLVGLICTAGTSSVAQGQSGKSRDRPNVLLILVDDLRPALNVYGDSNALSPHIDRLASKSILFESAYCNQAVCAPSRYTLMLGSRSSSTGIYGFGCNFRTYYPDAVTLPQYFKQNGYHSESIGKVFHIGHDTYNDALSWSIPHHKDLVIEYVDSSSKAGGMTREEALFSNLSAKGLPRGPAWESPDVADESYADGRVARRATERLAQLKKHSRPFFLAVGFARPHLPFSVPKKYWDLYDPNKLPLPDFETAPENAPAYAVKRDTEIGQYTPIPPSSESDPFPEPIKRKLIHGYYAGVSYVDAQIGKVLQALKELELEDNTIVVLWGDHGYHLGEMGIWTKHVNYELANRIPLIFSVPQLKSAHGVTLKFAETVDIFPTLAELAGLPTPKVSQPWDGRSLVPYFKNPTSPVRDHAYHCFPRGDRLGRAIRTERYRLVEWKKIGAPAEPPVFELYDYKDGPVEKKNIAADEPDVLASMKAILAGHPEAVPARPPSR